MMKAEEAQLRSLVWHDQFKTAVLAQAATFGLVAADTTPITNDNTDIHAKVTCLRREGSGYGRQASDLTTSKPTLPFVDQTGGVVQLDFDKSISDGVNIYAKRDGDADFVFLARDTASPYIDNRPLLVALGVDVHA